MGANSAGESSDRSGCVCIWRMRPDTVDPGTFLLIKLVDDPFCPSHHPGVVLDMTNLESPAPEAPAEDCDGA